MVIVHHTTSSFVAVKAYDKRRVVDAGVLLYQLSVVTICGLLTALKITKEAYVRFTIQFSSIAKPDCLIYIDTHVAIGRDRTSGRHLACRGSI